MRLLNPRQRQTGTTMIEVLVTILVLAIGLLGLAGLQARMQVAEMESYQRAQALVLLNDMASRLAANRVDASNYVTGSGSPTGTGVTCPTTSGFSTRRQIDTSEWCNALQGTAETQGGSKLGAMVGARGCVESIGTGGVSAYLITVAWQGMAPISIPPNSVACASGSYHDVAGTSDDRYRRVVTTIVRFTAL
jgi:type IV pilus assembly protein PilV